MPIVQVQFVAGPSRDQKRRLLTRISDAVVEELDVPASVVNVVLQEIDEDDWAVAGATVGELRQEAAG